MLSPAEAKAGGPETGKLSRPTPSLGSGSRPAAIAADRRASTSRLRAWTDGAASALERASSKVSGCAEARPGIAANRAEERRVGEEGGRTGRSGWAASQKKNRTRTKHRDKTK